MKLIKTNENRNLRPELKERVRRVKRFDFEHNGKSLTCYMFIYYNEAKGYLKAKFSEMRAHLKTIINEN